MSARVGAKSSIAALGQRENEFKSKDPRLPGFPAVAEGLDHRTPAIEIDLSGMTRENIGIVGLRLGNGGAG